MSISKKTVLITGCSDGGIGASMAKILHEKGLEDVENLELKATSKESIVRCAEVVRKRTGGTLDMLVNNAGRDFLIPLLDTDVEEAKMFFDVNFWSVLAVTQAFAPSRNPEVPSGKSGSTPIRGGKGVYNLLQPSKCFYYLPSN
ncbi:hypothetical protein DL770_008791 [Monosporascus sp. CRB-9-2]|nr:hypothetical protein DL770_008791 [Monosporascus sp. CRB-9-2]